MATARRFEELEAWQAARLVTRNVYSASQRALRGDFGLRDQMRRAAVSVMANIAEGYERSGAREFARYLSIAKASAGELESHLYVAFDLGCLTPAEFAGIQMQVRHCKRLIVGLMRYLANSRHPPA